MSPEKCKKCGASLDGRVVELRSVIESAGYELDKERKHVKELTEGILTPKMITAIQQAAARLVQFNQVDEFFDLEEAFPGIDMYALVEEEG